MLQTLFTKTSASTNFQKICYTERINYLGELLFMEIVKSSSTIQSLQVGMSIIDAIASTGSPLRFSDIQKMTDITKSNLYKYLNTLTQLELLYRDKSTGLYSLGSKLIQYGVAAIGQEDVVTKIYPYLQEISQRSNCTVLFSVWSNNGPLIARIQNSTQSLNIGAQIGSLLPPSSSSGKIFTCFLPPAITSEWISSTDYGPENRKMSENEIQNIKTHKIAFAKEPLVPSVSSLSIPILNYNSDLLGAITVVGFTDFVPADPGEELSQYIIEMSAEISRVFGHTEE